MLWPALLLGLVAPACRVLPPRPPAPIPEEALRDFSRGQEQIGNGDPESALQSFRRAIDRAPEFVDAHRAYQNLELSRYRRGQLIREYRGFLDQAPGSAPRRYLLARLWSDPGRQLEGFESALASDPWLYFGLIGKGYASLELGYLDRSETAFRVALEQRPERSEAAHGLLRVLSSRRDLNSLDAQVELATRLLEQDHGDALAKRVLITRQVANAETSKACQDAVRFVLETPSEDAVLLAIDTLEGYASLSDLRLARALLSGFRAPVTETPAWIRLEALVEGGAGDPRAALHEVQRALPGVAGTETIGGLRRGLLLRTGRVAEYLQEVQSRRYRSGFELPEEDESERLLQSVLRRLESPDGLAAPGEAERAVDDLLRLGLFEAGIAVARRALRERPEAAGLHRVLARALRHRRFLAELKQHFTAIYRQGDSVSLEQVFEDLREISVSCLGENVVDPVVTREYFPIGEFLEPDPAKGSGLARYFDSFGIFFMLGRRTLGLPEAYALTRIAQGHAQVGPNRIYRVLGEELLIPSATEWGGGEIAGFAFESFIVLNVDRVRDAAHAARRLYENHRGSSDELLGEAQLEPGGPGSNGKITGMSEPLSLAARASYRAYDEFLRSGGREEEYPGLLLNAVEVHERAHIRDAARFLPVLQDFGEKLSLLWSLRFSPTRIEVWLEERAQAVALFEARSSMAALVTIASMLPNQWSSPPHSAAYHELARSMVEGIASNLESYPELDSAFCLLPQLDRLGEEGLKRIARQLLEDEDVLPDF